MPKDMLLSAGNNGAENTVPTTQSGCPLGLIWALPPPSLGFPGGSVVKNLPANAGDRFDSWVRKIPWRRKWQPTPVLLPGERSLAGYSAWGHKESDTTEQLNNKGHFWLSWLERGYYQHQEGKGQEHCWISHSAEDCSPPQRIIWSQMSVGWEILPWMLSHLLVLFPLSTWHTWDFCVSVSPPIRTPLWQYTDLFHTWAQGLAGSRKSSKETRDERKHFISWFYHNRSPNILLQSNPSPPTNLYNWYRAYFLLK